MNGLVYIVSPITVVTGGTELLHQLCFYINKLGGNAKIVYPESYENSQVYKVFSERYNNPVCTSIDDKSENCLVVPETRIEMLSTYKKMKKYVWWLSVDNYYGAFKRNDDFIHRIVYMLKDTKNSYQYIKCKHLVQSEYARLFLINEKNIDENQIEYLSDYLNSTYLEEAVNNVNTSRENNVVYNPKKGIDFTKKIMEFIPEVNWIPLQGYTPVEMRNLMFNSKVYIDFGNHPGKDRIPREAAMCGCCIITGLRGSAGNTIDVPIPREFKFSDNIENIDLIRQKILSCIYNYDDEAVKFTEYRGRIMGEEKCFVEDIKKVFAYYIS